MKISSSKGIGLAEVSIAMALSALAGTFLTVQLIDMNDRSRGRSAGEHLANIAAAAKSVLALHGEQIKVEISGLAVNDTRTYALDDQAGTVTDDHWRAMLPSGLSYRNTYGHSYQLVVKKISADNAFEGMVVSVPPAGQKMPLSAQAAAMIPLGASGGAVRDTSAIMRGAGGGWSTSSTAWASVAQEGSLASYLEFHIAGSDGNTSQYLSRFDNGNPEHNTMRTDLHVNAPLHANGPIHANGELHANAAVNVNAGLSMHNSNINMNGRDVRGATTVQSWHMAAEHFCRHNTDPIECVSWEQIKNKVMSNAGMKFEDKINYLYCLNIHKLNSRTALITESGQYVVTSIPGSIRVNLFAGDQLSTNPYQGALLINGAKVNSLNGTTAGRSHSAYPHGTNTQVLGGAMNTTTGSGQSCRMGEGPLDIYRVN